jgi:hypothetical protein
MIMMMMIIIIIIIVYWSHVVRRVSRVVLTVVSWIADNLRDARDVLRDALCQ